MITNFNIFESLLNKGAPKVGYYIVTDGSQFSGSLAQAIKNQIGQIKSIKYSLSNPIYYVVYPNIAQQANGEPTIEIQHNEILFWSKNKIDLVSHLKGKCFDL